MAMNKSLKISAAALLVTSLFAIPSAAMAAGTTKPFDAKIQAPTQLKHGEKLTMKEGKALKGAKQLQLSDLKKKLSKKSAASSSQVVANAGTNNDPSTATPIDLNMVAGDTITAEGEQDWYYVYVPDAGKLTVYMQTVNNASVDYDLHLFRYNDSTGALENELDSAYGPTANEQISTLSQPGYYFICVDSYQGFDANNSYAFIAMNTQGYDAAEPDDNIWSAKALSGNFSVNQNLDNAYDADWIRYTVPKATNYQFTFNNAPASATYNLDVFDGSLNYLGTFTQNSTPKVTMSAGTYYFRISSPTSVDPATNYHFQVQKLSSAAAPDYISLVSVDSGGNGGLISDYGYGTYWRVENSMRVYGQVKDKDGEVVGDVPVAMAVQPDLGPQLNVSGYADDFGNFSLYTSLPPAAGDYSYYGYASTHYFDIIPMALGTTNNVSYSTYLYHYAYSIYHPF